MEPKKVSREGSGGAFSDLRLDRGVFAVPQITYYGMHQFFLTERAVYVIVWDATRFEGLSGEALDEVSSVTGLSSYSIDMPPYFDHCNERHLWSK